MHPLSASRLNDFLGCPHRAALWLGGIKPEGEVDATLRLIRNKGFEHEAAVLSRLEKQHGPAARVPSDGSLVDRVRLTQEAIERGGMLIYQGAISKDAWLGYPDFLLRTGATQEARFEPEDAKLSRKAKGEYILQLGIYAESLEALFGIPVQGGAIHVAPGDPESFDLRRTRYILKRLMRGFERFAADEARATKPQPCAACKQCDYKVRCEDAWRTTKGW
jgi:predicted RecB family nuclease